MSEPPISEDQRAELKDALKRMDVKETLALAFGRCPRCGQKTIMEGRWVRGCSRRVCGWYGTRGGPVQNVIDYNAPNRFPVTLANP